MPPALLPLQYGAIQPPQIAFVMHEPISGNIFAISNQNHCQGCVQKAPNTQLYLAPPQGWPCWNFAKMFDTR